MSNPIANKEQGMSDFEVKGSMKNFRIDNAISNKEQGMSKFEVDDQCLIVNWTTLHNSTFLVPCWLLGCHFVLLIIPHLPGNSTFLVPCWLLGWTFTLITWSFTS